jgi:CcmD family protein
MVKKLLILVLLCLLNFGFAQPTQAVGPDMATAFYAEGKIYVVIAVVSIVFIGLAVYLLRMDKRISKLENQD